MDSFYHKVSEGGS